MENLNNNNLYEILTPYGWEDFKGILPTNHKSYLRIEFDDGTDLICSLSHKIKYNNNFIEAQNLEIGQILDKKEIIWIEYIQKNIELYDPVNVGDKHEYIGNDLTHHNCVDFIGSAGTLISSQALKNLAFVEPIQSLLDHKLHIYEKPIGGHRYILTADVSHGKELDFSAFCIFDVTTMPYRVVAKYRCNDVGPQIYPNYIAQTAKYYNEAYCLVENNDIGALILKILIDDLEYENVIYTDSHQEYKDTQITNKSMKSAGLRTTSRTKRQGCMALKEMIENEKLILTDFDIISELTTFVIRPNKTYAADEEAHDDLVMSLVLFSWLTTQSYFKDLTNTNMKDLLYAERQRMLDEEMPIPGVLVTATAGPGLIKDGGILWQIVEDERDEVDIRFTGYSQNGW